MGGPLVRTSADVARVLPGRADLGGMLDAGRDFSRVSPAQLDRYIDDNGLWVEWRRGVACPCARPETRAPAVGCPLCGGVGHLYPQDRRDRVRCLMSGRNGSTKPYAVAELVTGMVTLTFKLGEIPHGGDMVFPQKADGTPRERHEVSQLLVRAELAPNANRGALADDRTHWNALSPKPKPVPERLRYADAVEVEWVGWKESDPDHPGTDVLRIARAGEDYDLRGNEFIWRPGRGPLSGVTYSVHYTAPAAYMVADSNFRGLGDVDLQRAVTAIRLDQWDPSGDHR